MGTHLAKWVTHEINEYLNTVIAYKVSDIQTNKNKRWSVKWSVKPFTFFKNKIQKWTMR